MFADASSDYDSPYRWVMALITAVVMTTSFLSLTAFSVAAPAIAETLGIPVGALTAYGVDGFSIGLFVAFFVGHGGLFDTRIRSGVFLAQALLIVPQLLIPFLMPLTHSLWLFTILRFSQGLVIMMVALFSIQLSRWFRPSQRAFSLAAVTGGIPLGGAIGAEITGALAHLGWEQLYYVTALIMVAGAAVYFIFARHSEHGVAQLRAAKGTAHPSAGSSLMTWLMGFVQIPLTWALFTLGGFLPAYAFRLGYKVDQVGHVMFIWGVVGFFTSIVGALLGDWLVGSTTTNRGRVNAHLVVISLGNLLMAVGALMVVYVAPGSPALLLVSAVVLAFLFMIPPNYWATPAAVFPLATVGAGAFAMGAISNSTSAIGPVVSSILVPTFGWSGVFWLIAIIALVGVGINVIAMRTTLPADQPADQVASPAVRRTSAV